MVAPLLIGRLLGAGLLRGAALAEARLTVLGIAEERTVEELTDQGPSKESITVPVTSTAIRTVGWDGEDKTIIVEFNKRGTYTYDGSYELFLAFIASSSKGKFFNSNFR